MQMLSTRVVFSLGLAFACGNFGFAQKNAPASRDGNAAKAAFEKQTAEELRKGIEQKHPAAYYVLATKLFAQDKDEAVFWFYAGQLRYRIYLAANPDLPRSGEPALFAALNETVGRPMNEYAFGDVPKLARTIDRVLAWDDEHENGLTSKTRHQEVIDSTRQGLVKLREHIVQNEDEIRRQRRANGLE